MSGILSHDRVKVNYKRKRTTAMVDITDTSIQMGAIGIFKELQEDCGIKEGEVVSIALAKIPVSVEYIRKKMKGASLKKR